MPFRRTGGAAPAAPASLRVRVVAGPAVRARVADALTAAGIGITTTDADDVAGGVVNGGSNGGSGGGSNGGTGGNSNRGTGGGTGVDVGGGAGGGTAAVVGGGTNGDVGGAASGAASGAWPVDVDVVLLDLGPPDAKSAGLAVLTGLVAGAGAPAVLVLTGERPDRRVLRALRAGARGYAPAALPGPELARLVRAAAAGETVLGPAGPPGGPAATARVRTLGGRDAEVLACLGEGLTDRQLARCLRLPRASVERRVARVLDRLGCADRVEAGLLAYAAGL